MLDTRFPRPLGDVGHADTFPVPVRHLVVQGAFPRRVVGSASALRASGLHLRFIEAVRQLEAEDAVSVPVVSSSLLQLPELLAAQAQVGVLTISASHLTEDYMLAAGVPSARLADVLVQGVDPDGAFARALLGNESRLDLAAAEADVVGAALALRARTPQLRTVVLECTNMPPYAKAVADATRWQVRTLLDARALLDWADG
jgi:maleate cis-trans isomerase